MLLVHSQADIFENNRPFWNKGREREGMQATRMYSVNSNTVQWCTVIVKRHKSLRITATLQDEQTQPATALRSWLSEHLWNVFEILYPQNPLFGCSTLLFWTQSQDPVRSSGGIYLCTSFCVLMILIEAHTQRSESSCLHPFASFWGHPGPNEIFPLSLFGKGSGGVNWLTLHEKRSYRYCDVLVNTVQDVNVSCTVWHGVVQYCNVYYNVMQCSWIWNILI